jgi:DNA-binding CsgD family transcriptional regulator
VTKLEEALSELAQVETTSSLQVFLEGIRVSYKLANIAFHVVTSAMIPKQSPLIFVTYDEQWVKRYLSKDYFTIDPIEIWGSHNFLPLDWNDVDRSCDRIGSLFAEAASYGVGNCGITLPIQGPMREKSLFTVAAFESDNEWSRRRLSRLRDFQVLAHFIHERSMGLIGGRPCRQQTKLSRRECQCIQLLARGRAPKRIAFELGISVRAVRLYICSARIKLGARNTNHAVALAVNEELIEA